MENIHVDLKVLRIHLFVTIKENIIVCSGVSKFTFVCGH